MPLFQRLILTLIHFFLAISHVSCAPNDSIKALSPRASPDEDAVAAALDLMRDPILERRWEFCPPCVEVGLELYVRANRNPDFSGITSTAEMTDQQARARQKLKEMTHNEMVSLHNTPRYGSVSKRRRMKRRRRRRRRTRDRVRFFSQNLH